MSKVRRKPAPAFPYSPKYPHPDPADPFVPLKILRDRAQSTNALHPHHSRDSLSQVSHGSHGYGGQQYILSVSPEGLGQSSEVSYTPRTVDPFDPQPPVRPWQDSRSVGYSSDTTKPARPPRAKTRPSRESRSYFADVDMPAAVPRPRPQESDAERPAEQEIPQRRRSKSIFVLSREESRPTDAPPSTPPKQTKLSDARSTKQYTYHDRQSHGYVYNESDAQGLHHMQSSSTMDMHQPTSAHSGGTPPMTPDDSTSLSSTSLRNRSRSRSPPAPMPEIPKALMQNIVTSQHNQSEPARTAVEADTPSNIISEDFPLLATPHNASTKATAQSHRGSPQAAHAASEPEAEAYSDSGIRRRLGTSSVRDARMQSKRMSIAVARGRQMDSTSNARPSPRQRSSSSLSSSSSASQNQHARGGLSRGTGTARFGSSKAAESDSGVASRSKLLVPPKAKKSVSHLSHMSLGVSGLPNSPFPSTANNSTTELSAAFHSKEHSPEPGPRDPGVRRAATVTAQARSQTQQVIANSQPPEKLSLGERVLHHSGSTSRLLGSAYVNTLSIIESRSATSRDDVSTENSRASTLPTILPSPAPSRPTPLTLIKSLDSPLPPPPRTPSPEPVLEQTPDWSPNPRALSDSPVQTGYDASVLTPERTPAETPVPMPAPFPLTPPNQYSDFPTPLPLPSVPSIAPTPAPVPPVPPLPTSMTRQVYRAPQDDQSPEVQLARSTTPQPPREPEAPARESSRPLQIATKPKYLTVPPPTYGSAQHETHLARRATAPARSAYEQAQSVTRSRTPPVDPQLARSPSPEPGPVPVQRLAHAQLETRSRTPPVQEPVRAHEPEPDAYGPRHAFVDPRIEEEKRSRAPPVQAYPRAQSPQHDLGHSRHHTVLRHPLVDEPRSRTPPVQAPVRAQSPPPEPRHPRYPPVASHARVHEDPRSRTPPVEVPQRAVSPAYDPHGTQPFETPSRDRSPSPEARPARHATAQDHRRVTEEERPARHATDPGHRYGHRDAHMREAPRSETAPAELYHGDAPAIDRSARPARHATTSAQSHAPTSVPEYPTYHPLALPSDAYRSKTTLPAPPFRSISPVPPAEFHVPPPPEEVLPPAVESPVIPETYVRNSQKRRPAQRAPSDAHSSTRSHERAASRTAHDRPLQSHPTQSRRGEGAVQHASQNARQRNTAPPTPMHDWMTSASSTAYSHPYPSSSTTASGAARAQTANRARPFLPPPKFDEFALPTLKQMEHASSLFIVAQDGIRVAFGSLFTDRKAIVIFMRHFWCAMCQDYMHSVMREVDPKALERAGIDLVFIGCGSPVMIKSYSNIFHTPFSIYTDPSQRLYAALGMTLRTTDAGSDAERGSYVRHGVVGGLAMVVRNALRVGMPVWERGGDVAQLGGEFVLGPGLECTWAHRMTTTRNHMRVRDVLAAAGVPASPASDTFPSGGTSEDAWSARAGSTKRGMPARPRRRTTAEEWCMDELGEMPYGADLEQREPDVPGCWGLMSSKGTSESRHVGRYERERGRERERERERDHDSYKGSLQLHTGRERSVRERERERTGRRERDASKGPRTTPRRAFIVANPDHDDSALPALPPPVHTHARASEEGWESDGAVSMRYVDEFGQGYTYAGLGYGRA